MPKIFSLIPLLFKDYQLRSPLANDSIAITDQIRVLSKSCLLRLWGRLSEEAIAQLNRALLIALDLPGQDDKILLDVDNSITLLTARRN
ncbi:type II toxin-antitoxin system PemK/MazF family toxin [Nostoc sp. UHCC 0926]|uniref:type II toxin-antitoxin system PemK/MazF family toxin n=1 Tax=unclassified Nostoc TaxID=2593658 RepID=UPI0023605BA9|nr:type II toxin-antitoxin system PemK/MazF family toxin [Nostoc sp. UHCC 0926]WDD35169.1 type II toxin-antitoxin system PemK/MazF family toxin [Nostoc sp. UHCC 0926]